MKYVFSLMGQPLFGATYEFQDEGDKNELLLHLQEHLGQVTAMRSFVTTDVRPYDHAEATIWLKRNARPERSVPALPAPPQKDPAAQPRKSTYPAARQEPPNLKGNGVVLVNFVSEQMRLFGHAVLFRDEVEYQLYTRLLRRAVPNLQCKDAGKELGVPPKPRAWIRWFARSRHPAWELATSLLQKLEHDMTGVCPSLGPSATSSHEKTKQKRSTAKQNQQAAAAMKTKVEKGKKPASVLLKNQRPYFLWAGPHCLNTMPVRLTPEEVTRLIGLLRHCVLSPDTGVRAESQLQNTKSAPFRRAALYSWCSHHGHFDLPRLAGYLELSLQGMRPEGTAAPRRVAPDISPPTTTMPTAKPPVWPGQHPRPHEWATSDQIEFNVFEYK